MTLNDLAYGFETTDILTFPELSTTRTLTFFMTRFDVTVPLSMNGHFQRMTVGAVYELIESDDFRGTTVNCLRTRVFAREEFFDSMVGAHVKMTFFFSSLPDGEERVYQEIMKYRRSKPLSTIHFCKDKQIIGGCVAGGRYFLNIDSVGNVQPCFFVRESDTNLREKTLIEALQAPLMMSYHDQEQPCKAGK
jgi:hypothetical protein